VWAVILEAAAVCKRAIRKISEEPIASAGPLSRAVISLDFPRGPAPRTAQKDGQDLPVRQTLPPRGSLVNGVKTQRNQGKNIHSKWHGACDSLFGNKAQGSSK
jgi:hypothetical protein